MALGMSKAEYDRHRRRQEAEERAWAEEVADIDGAQAALAAYVATLDARYLPGGTYATRCVPSGEAFIEFTCGGVFTGRKLCECYSPMVAVRVFIDTIERYGETKLRVAHVRRPSTLYWRVHPQLRGYTETWERYDPDALRKVARTETRYNVMARLLIV